MWGGTHCLVIVCYHPLLLLFIVRIVAGILPMTVRVTSATLLEITCSASPAVDKGLKQAICKTTTLCENITALQHLVYNCIMYNQVVLFIHYYSTTQLSLHLQNYFYLAIFYYSPHPRDNGSSVARISLGACSVSIQPQYWRGNTRSRISTGIAMCLLHKVFVWWQEELCREVIVGVVYLKLMLLAAGVACWREECDSTVICIEHISGVCLLPYWWPQPVRVIVGIPSQGDGVSQLAIPGLLLLYLPWKLLISLYPPMRVRRGTVYIM